MCLEMGSGEEKTKPSYYRVAYSVITLVQGVLLYEKKKKTLHWLEEMKGSGGKHMNK